MNKNMLITLRILPAVTEILPIRSSLRLKGVLFSISLFVPPPKKRIKTQCIGRSFWRIYMITSPDTTE